jgi:hypothetical protein
MLRETQDISKIHPGDSTVVTAWGSAWCSFGCCMSAWRFHTSPKSHILALGDFAFILEFQEELLLFSSCDDTKNHQSRPSVCMYISRPWNNRNKPNFRYSASAEILGPKVRLSVFTIPRNYSTESTNQFQITNYSGNLSKQYELSVARIEVFGWYLVKVVPGFWLFRKGGGGA